MGRRVSPPSVPVPFADRTRWDLSENTLATALRSARERGAALVDLTESNPTRVGLGLPGNALAVLGEPRAARYAPDARGLRVAREAVSAYYEARGVEVDPARVVLSASSSEAYGWLFKLLANRGDRVLIPAPSYPLLGYLAGLEEVELAPYALTREEGWAPDVGSVLRAIDERTRALVLLHPNNPTGSFVPPAQARALSELAAARGLALIVDEVFLDYGLPERRSHEPSFAARTEALTFVLGGLSKALAAPQLKLGWTVVSGPDDLVEEALRRLEVIADTYLSVATPIQLAAPALFSRMPPVQAAIVARLQQNLTALDAALQGIGPAAASRRLPVEGGWYALLEIPRTRSDDAWVTLLVERAGVIVHPGHYFDVPYEGTLVLSLLPEPTLFAEAVRRLLALVEAG